MRCNLAKGALKTAGLQIREIEVSTDNIDAAIYFSVPTRLWLCGNVLGSHVEDLGSNPASYLALAKLLDFFPCM